MKGKQLLTQLQEFGDDVVESSVRTWIDMAQKEVALDLPVVQTITTNNVVRGTTVSVATGILNVLSAFDEDGEYPLTNIQIKPASLVFLEPAGFVTVTFTTGVPDYVNMAEELTIHPSLHSAVVYYLISMYYDKEGEGDNEESGLAERFYQRWLYYKNLALANLSSTTHSQDSMTPIDTLDVMPKPSKRMGVESYYE